MSKKISAEFLSVDAAENAARNIRENFKSIKNITIKPQNGEDYTGYHNSTNDTILPVQNGNALYNGSNDSAFIFAAAFTSEPISSHEEKNELNLRQQAWLEVYCDESDTHAVTSTLRYHGGTKIKDII